MEVNWTDRYMTVKQAAEALGYTERYTRGLIAEGKLDSTMIGTSRMVEKASVKAMKERRPA